MSQPPEKKMLLAQLQQEILSLQGFRKAMGNRSLDTGLGVLQSAFPAQTFPTGAVHEWISYTPEEAAATCGFMAGLAGQLMQHNGYCFWISTRRLLFPPALAAFGIAPEQVIFVDLRRMKDALWAIEEVLKCKSAAVVVGEIPELSFTESRRLQLAVEHSRVTGFLHRHQPRSENTVACVTRWKVRPLSSYAPDGLPGPGFPRWQVQLLKVRNGRPGSWAIEWREGAFALVQRPALVVPHPSTRKTG